MVATRELPAEPKQLLPKEAYTSQEWLDLENKLLFSNTWTYAGVVTELPNPGDYKAFNAGTYPLCVIRGRDGELRAFHNLCRHRGTELLDRGTGCAGKTIVCPYHRWTFNLDGGLRGVPNQAECFPDLKKEHHGLFPASMEIFKGMIFVHPQEEPSESFTEWLGDLGDVAWPHDITDEDMEMSEEVTYEMKCNWKVFYENAIDGYHLAYLHENTLGALYPEANVWDAHGRHVVWYSTEREGEKHPFPVLVENFMEEMKAKKAKGADNANYGGVYMMFPTTLITPGPYGIAISQLIPVAPDVTLLKARSWSPKGAPARRADIAALPGYDENTGLVVSDKWEQHPLETLDFQTEDVYVCEKMQRAMNSPKFEIGALAKGAGGEAPLAHFQQSVLEFVPLEEFNK